MMNKVDDENKSCENCIFITNCVDATIKFYQNHNFTYVCKDWMSNKINKGKGESSES